MADQASSIYNRYSDLNGSTLYPVSLFSRTAAVQRCRHTDWDLCESIRLQELKEARERAAQMEKTMRWWSECTANWREKWSIVRDERNRAREEGQALRHAYEEANAKLIGLQTEKREVEMELLKTKSALHKLVVQTSIEQNQPLDVPEGSVEKVDEGCDAKPESFTEYVQTDDDPIFLSLDLCTSARSVFGSRPSLEQRVRLHLEEKCAELQTKLNTATKLVAELEEAKNTMSEEILRLKECHNDNKESSEPHDNAELEQLRTQLAELQAEVKRLQDENSLLKKSQDSEAVHK